MTDFCLNFVGKGELVLSMNISSSESKLEMLSGKDRATVYTMLQVVLSLGLKHQPVDPEGETLP